MSREIQWEPATISAWAQNNGQENTITDWFDFAWRVVLLNAAIRDIEDSGVPEAGDRPFVSDAVGEALNWWIEEGDNSGKLDEYRARKNGKGVLPEEEQAWLASLGVSHDLSFLLRADEFNMPKAIITADEDEAEEE